MSTVWSDVLGNDITAEETLALYNDTKCGRTLEQWIQDTALELWGEPITEETAAEAATDLLETCGII